MVLKYFLSWFGLLAIAMFNGFCRELFFAPYVGDLLAHQISVFTGICLFAVFIWFLETRWPLESSYQAWIVGCIWLVMTVSFEFLFFHFVRNVPWSVLLHDYNIFEGRVWILVLIWITIAPYVLSCLRSKYHHGIKRLCR
jgi:hypothetical protein